MKKNVYFVSGIDTNIGKSYATWLQRLTSVRLTSTRLNGLRRR